MTSGPTARDAFEEKAHVRPPPPSPRKAIALAGVVILSGSSLLVFGSSAPTRLTPWRQSAVEAPASSESDAKANAGASFAKLPLSFEPNVGQTAEEVKYLARGKGYSIFVTPGEVVLSLAGASAAPDPAASKADLGEREEAAMRPDVLRMSWVGANAAAEFTAGDLLPGKSNYFTGNDSAKWHTDVPNYGRLRAEGVYDGIDVDFYGNQQQLEYDFRVNPAPLRKG